jgi:hypothetical protein
MTDLDTQIRELMEQVHAARPEAPDLGMIDAPLVLPQRPESRSRPAWAAALAGALATMVIVGVPAILLLRDGGGPAGQIDPVVPEPAAITFSPIAEPPDGGILNRMVTGDNGRVFATGSTGTWASNDGETWTRIGPSFALLAAFGDTVAGWSENGAVSITLDGVEWSAPYLPEDLTPERSVVPVHPAVTLRYRVEDIAIGPKGFVIQGFATSSIGPAAVEAAYPGLGRVVDVTRAAPCGPDGESLQCELPNDDALWVLTNDGVDWRAVSLSGMGLTKADVWRSYRIVWFSDDGVSFETVDLRVLSERGYGPLAEGLVAGDDGFVMVDGGLWTSADGRTWKHVGATPYEVSDLFTVGSRVYGFTNLDRVVEYHPDGSWTLAADPGPLRDLGYDEVMIEAVSEGAFIAVGYDHARFPAVDPWEPLSTAAMIAVSVDGFSWRTLTLEETFGATGAVELAVAGDQLVVGFGAEQPEDVERIANPEWWIGTIDD